MSFSNFLETEILDHVFGGNAYTAPATLYLGLYTTGPTDGTNGVEVSGLNYARQSAAMTVSGDTATTSASVEFPAAGDSWGTVTHVGVFDASSGGNLMAYGLLTASKTIDTGDIFRIPAGSLDITLD